ncbi:aldehyde dehydrogenase family 3 member B1-like isoform X2 [Cimex lectularius]|uniref:Aldehyde dehydrogenase domain-containing protein n=2 Tax=Cimex lectularius TaxID=79782 RepID=A0A8I6RF02_CIMLE|nr:aldehyde dehydrogenase family 3 member B1-like isoform X2 [Cimex lectularius]
MARATLVVETDAEAVLLPRQSRSCLGSRRSSANLEGHRTTDAPAEGRTPTNMDSPLLFVTVDKKPPSPDELNPAKIKDTMSQDKDIDGVLLKARTAFAKGKSKPYEFRKQQLKNIIRMCEVHRDEFYQALKEDLNKSVFESALTEIDITINEAKNALSNLKSWMEPYSPPKTILTLLDEAVIVNDPRGVVLIIGAWNYPVNLILMPLIGAIAAGNCVILKPSENSPATSKALTKIIPQYLDKDCYHVLFGGVKLTENLLKRKFDYIFYTGSKRVGQLVRAAANEHLTPVTLEMGGKSPVFIDKTANISIAARRILWGKCINSGQTCIAPDYILCSKDIQSKLVEELKKGIEEFFGEKPLDSKDICSIINEVHFKRLCSLLKEGTIVVGGNIREKDRKIAPTVLTDVKLKESVMEDEIFGPILPIYNVETVEDAVNFINERDLPLACYVFSQDKKVQKQFITGTSSGGICINDTVIYAIVNSLPFGGVGASGIGAYHGKYTFDTFTHKKSCVVKGYNAVLDRIWRIRYPPYTTKKHRLLAHFLGMRMTFCGPLFVNSIVFIFGLIVGQLGILLYKRFSE